MRVLLADDQPQVRSGLRLLLEHRPAVQVVGEVQDSTALLERMKVTCPDLVLLDGELPGLAAADLLLAIRSLCPQARVIVLSGRPELRQAVLDAGADAFVSKGDPPECLLAALGQATPGARAPGGKKPRQ
ncbi:MAG: response regulator transcription factor [Chloroflexi bacterium]|nr:response regulator transcription factor [Chloroflexota bacterium]